MKIPESIIKKLQLTPSGEQCGVSFLNNLLIYKSGIPGFENARVMECDMHGESINGIMLSVNGLAGNISPELLETAPIEKILSIVKEAELSTK